MAKVDTLGLNMTSNDPRDTCALLARNFQAFAGDALAAIEKSETVADVLEALLVSLKRGVPPSPREVEKVLRLAKSFRRELAELSAAWKAKTETLRLFDTGPAVN